MNVYHKLSSNFVYTFLVKTKYNLSENKSTLAYMLPNKYEFILSMQSSDNKTIFGKLNKHKIVTYVSQGQKFKKSCISQGIFLPVGYNLPHEIMQFPSYINWQIFAYDPNHVAILPTFTQY